MKQLQKTELLVPAGSLSRLKTAILYGADSVYMGSSLMSLRSKSEFSLDEIKEGAEFVKKHNKKFYLTLNLFSHNSDVENLPLFVNFIKQVEPDGVLIADPGIFSYLKEQLPNLPLHISTQANVCSWISVDFWQKQGASLCVLAREVSFSELKEIKEKCPNIKLEAFVHGAMCMTYSGRCLLSNFMAERGSNQGSCAHSCRWNYKLNIKINEDKYYDLLINDNNKDLFDFALEEEFRPGEYFPIEEDNKGSYILNSKDLCLMPVLDDYLKLGIETLKIEGRHKSEYYVAAVTRIYRKAIDDYYNNPSKWNSKQYMEELYTLSNRGYTTAFHNGRLTNLAHNYATSKSLSVNLFAGVVTEVLNDSFIVLIKNHIEVGEVLEFVSPNYKIIRLRLYEFILYPSGEIVEKVSAGSKNSVIKIPFSLFHNEDLETLKTSLPKLTVIRKINPDNILYKDLFRYQKNSILLEGSSNENTDNNKIETRLLKAKSNIDSNNLNTAKKSPKLGDSGCCYKGCNGCLVFWDKEKNIIKTKQELLKNN